MLDCLALGITRYLHYSVRCGGVTGTHWDKLPVNDLTLILRPTFDIYCPGIFAVERC
jgi:hypothetical protein